MTDPDIDDRDEHGNPQSFSPEDQPAVNSKDLRLLGKVWKSFAKVGMAKVPTKVMGKYCAALIDKTGVLDEKCPEYLMRERRLFLEFLQKQDHHDEKIALERLRLGMDDSGDGSVEITLPDWVRRG